MPHIDWDNPQIKVALLKAKAKADEAPYRKKNYTLENEFAKYTGVWQASTTIKKHIKKYILEGK